MYADSSVPPIVVLCNVTTSLPYRQPERIRPLRRSRTRGRTGMEDDGVGTSKT
jgi:hypothetical protein